MYESLSMLFVSLYCIVNYVFFLFLSLADEIKLLKNLTKSCGASIVLLVRRCVCCIVLC